MFLVAKVAALAVAATATAGLTAHQAHVAHVAHLAHVTGQGYSHSASHGSSGSSSSSSSSGSSVNRPAIVTSGTIISDGQADVPGTVPGGFSFYGLEYLWLKAGGNPSMQGVAACIAQKESGGLTSATGNAGERGLWQIAPSWGSLSTYNPIGNARAAVIISHNGSNWRAWSTRGLCGV